MTLKFSHKGAGTPSPDAGYFLKRVAMASQQTGQVGVRQHVADYLTVQEAVTVLPHRGQWRCVAAQQTGR